MFESLFVRTVAQCVEAGLVGGSKLHVDASLVDANASKDSVIKSPPELIAALKRAYSATESKLEIGTTPESYQSVNDRMMSQSDPDAACVRKGGGESRPRYHHHRAVDDYKGAITAVETTPGTIAENKKLLDLIDQHQKNTDCQVQTVIADHKYGTNENYVACQERGIETHMGEVTRYTANTGRKEGIFGDEAFSYDPAANVYRCPAGQILEAAPGACHSPHPRIQSQRKDLWWVLFASAMHAFRLWTHGAETRKTRATKCGPCPSQQPCGNRKSHSSPARRHEFCRYCYT